MNYDTLIYEVCEELLSIYHSYSAQYEKDWKGNLMCVRIYSDTNRFSCCFMEALIERKGSLLVGFSCDETGRPVITIYNEIEP